MNWSHALWHPLPAPSNPTTWPLKMLSWNHSTSSEFPGHKSPILLAWPCNKPFSAPKLTFQFGLTVHSACELTFGYRKSENTSLGVLLSLSNKESACDSGATGDAGSTTRWRRTPRRGHGNPLQYSCLGNPMDRGGWWVTVHGIAKSRTRLKQFSMHALPLWSLGWWEQPGMMRPAPDAKNQSSI